MGFRNMSVTSHRLNHQQAPIKVKDRQGLQQHFYEEECDPEFEINRPHQCGRLYDFLIDYKCSLSVELLSADLRNATLLEVCCGSGMMTEKFARLGANVTGTDFSGAAITRANERAQRYKFDAAFAVADAQHLEYGDRTFDFAYVHDGLHHLDDPYAAIREMARVAKRGVLIMDPAKAAITALAVRMGIAEDVEDAGNEVKRLDPAGVARCLQEQGFPQVSWRRTLMYYQHEPFAWFRWFEKEPMFSSFRLAFAASNAVAGRWGNKLTLVAKR
jgi:2-polyprenyl-3-methyl-5-hydroxy-6-metoxy-1,4-benzoquinol methylase